MLYFSAIYKHSVESKIMLDQNFEKPEFHLILDQIESEVCFIKLNIVLEEKNINFENSESKNLDQKLQDIFDSINVAIENKMKTLKEIISGYECNRFMSMTIPVVFLTPIPSGLLADIDAYFKSKDFVYYNRVLVKFKRIQPDVLLEVERLHSIQGRNSTLYINNKSIDLLPTIEEFVEPEEKPKTNHEFIAQHIQSVKYGKLESRKFSDHPNRSNNFSSGNQSAFFKSSNTTSKCFNFPKFGIFKKHKHVDKKLESVGHISISSKCQ